MRKLVIKRERLYKVVWEEPLDKLSEKYYISQNKLKEICRILNVPMPNKKYWTQCKMGNKTIIEELPENCQQDEWIEYINEYDIKRREELKRDSLDGYDEEEQERIRKAIQNINIHPKNENRIDSIYHQITSVIESLGYPVKIENGKCIAIIKREEIAFKIREKSKIQYRNPTKKDYPYQILYVKGEPKIKELIPSGDLELKIDCYGKKDTWVDTAKNKLEDLIGQIVIELFYCATKKKETRREREEEHKKYEEEEKKKTERKFLLRPQELKKIFEIGKKISKINLGFSGSKMRIYILEDIIEKIILHLGSYLKITKISDITELDISILATIARNIMECGNTYYYYAERKITDEEVDLRYHIANLHYENSMIDIVKKLGYPQDNFRTQTLYMGKDISKRLIQRSQIYQELSNEEKSQVLNGNQAYIKKRQKEIHSILDKDIESAVYNIFSNSAHAYYIGLGNNSMNGSVAHTSYITPEMLLSLATEISILYAANILEDYLQLRKKLNHYITQQEKDFIKNMTSTDKLLRWLEVQKEEYADTFFDMKWEDKTQDIIL